MSNPFVFDRTKDTVQTDKPIKVKKEKKEPDMTEYVHDEFNFPLNSMDYSPAPSMEDLRDEIGDCNLKYTLMKK